MPKSEQNSNLVEFKEISFPVHKFRHYAMATIYEILIIEENAGYAKEGAFEAFNELDKLEEELSRFRENSDIGRINNLAKNEHTIIGLATLDCLMESAKIYHETKKAFDITIGPLLKCWLNKDKTLRSPSERELETARLNTGLHLLQLDTKKHVVKVLADDIQVDLGGIGKGYAIDFIGELLPEWGFKNTLIHGGASSALALGAPPDTKGWPLSLSNPANREQLLTKLYLKDTSISGSGLQKGQHIIDPRSGLPVNKNNAAWVVTPKAITCDALSTAFTIMGRDEVEDYCKQNASTSALIISEDKSIQRYGDMFKN